MRTVATAGLDGPLPHWRRCPYPAVVLLSWSAIRAAARPATAAVAASKLPTPTAVGALGSSTMAEDTASGEDSWLVPLQREAVPVLKQGAAVAFKTAYFGKISVGSPVPQEFSVIFDTGSGHVVLPSLLCESRTCLAHRRYDMSASPEAKPLNADGSEVPEDDLGDQVTIGFGTGTVTGEFVRESVCLSHGHPTSAHNSTGGEPRDYPCSTMGIVVAVEMSDKPFESFQFDGIFGLGLQSLALTPEFNFFAQHANAARGRSAHCFGVFVTSHEEHDNGEQSEIAIGGYNSARIAGPVAWEPVAMPKLGYWLINISAVYIGSTALDACRDGSCRAILDTGTSHLGVPAGQQQRIGSLLSDEGAVGTRCSRAEGAPDLRIDIGNFALVLHAEDYMSAPPQEPLMSQAAAAAGSSDPALAPAARLLTAMGEGTAASQRQQRCQPRLMPVSMKRPLGPNLFILGEPVLQRYYTMYDTKKQQVGFGRARRRRPTKEAAGAAAAPAVSQPPPGALQDSPTGGDPQPPPVASEPPEFDAIPDDGRLFLIQLSLEMEPFG